ncbi:MAG: asparagine synthase-related protein [Nitrososphaerota archaeon]
MTCRVEFIYSSIDNFKAAEQCTIIYDANNELDDLPSDLQTAVKDLEQLGEFAFMGRSGDKYFIGTDYSASRPVYYLASDYRIIASTRLALLPDGYVKVLPPSSLLMSDGSIEEYTTANYAKADASASFLLNLLRASLVKRIGKRKTIAIAFSGGLDSSLLAWICKDIARVELFSVSVDDANDTAKALEAAGQLMLPLIQVSLDKHKVSEIIDTMNCKRICNSNMDYALATGFIAVAREASRRGHDMLISGQGADELFGGYKKYTTGDKALAQSMMNEDLKHLYTGLGRDSAAIFEGGCRPSFPYLDRSIVEFAKRTPYELKIRHNERKVILRMAASLAGLPESIVKREKKAFQYSSGLSRLIKKMNHIKFV